MPYRPRRTLSMTRIAELRERDRKRYAERQKKAGFGYRERGQLSEEEHKRAVDETLAYVKRARPELFKESEPAKPAEPQETLEDYMKKHGLWDDSLNDPLKEGEKK